MLDQSDTFDGLHRGKGELGVTGGQGEGERVEDQVFRFQAVLAGYDVIDRARDLQLAFARLRHSDLVDRERDHRGAVRDNVRYDGVDSLAAIFHVDRVDDRAARVLFQ